MGYYFGKALSRSHLDQAQRMRFDEILGPEAHLPSAVHQRLERAKEYVGPVSSGETTSALRELYGDIVARWILADEDPRLAQWIDPEDLVGEPVPLTEDQVRWDAQERLAQAKRSRRLGKAVRAWSKQRSQKVRLKLDRERSRRPWHEKLSGGFVEGSATVLLWIAAGVLFVLSGTYNLGCDLWNRAQARQSR